jgi:hypothetical protein
MSEAPENITNRPPEGLRATDVTNEPPRANPPAYEMAWFTLPAPRNNKLFLYLLVATLLVGVPALALGFLILAVEKVSTASARTQSLNNLKQMCLAVDNCSSTSTRGYIPPSYGYFPPTNTTSPKQSFFVWLLPYIDGVGCSYTQNAANNNVPVKTYIAQSDPFNPTTSDLISYGSNATLLTVNGAPTLPGSFAGRQANVIIVFERTAKSGATWHNASSYLIDTGGSSSPEFGEATSWSGYGSRATALVSGRCLLGMGDGSARIVTQSNANAGWAWAMDPSVGTTAVPNAW